MPKLNSTRIKHRIAELDLSSEDLSRATGIPWGTLRNNIAGTYAISLKRVYKVGRALGLSVDEIIASDGEGVADPPPQQPKGPTGRPQRKDTEEKKTGPKRLRDQASAA